MRARFPPLPAGRGILSPGDTNVFGEAGGFQNLPDKSPGLVTAAASRNMKKDAVAFLAFLNQKFRFMRKKASRLDARTQTAAMRASRRSLSARDARTILELRRIAQQAVVRMLQPPFFAAAGRPRVA